jgi:hypothetical protein
MSRSARARSGLGFELDWDQLHRVMNSLKGTQQQAEMAYRRAMTRTAKTLDARVRRVMMAGIKPKNARILKNRIRQFKLSAKGSYLPGFKLWFGLNRVKAKDLRGRVRYSPAPHHTLRDPTTGRYTSGGDVPPVPPSFLPQGPMLKSKSWVYPGGFVRPVNGDLRILVPEQGHLYDADVDIYDAMMVTIEDEIFSDATEIFMRHFTTDLRGRVKAGIHSYRGR